MLYFQNSPGLKSSSVDVGNHKVIVQLVRSQSNLQFIIFLFYVEFSEPRRPNMKNKILHSIEIRMNSELGRKIKPRIR